MFATEPMPEDEKRHTSVSDIRARFSSGNFSSLHEPKVVPDKSSSVADLRSKFEKTTLTSTGSPALSLRKVSQESLISQSGATDMSKHSFDSMEESQFIGHINEVLAEDEWLSARFPLTTETFLDQLNDGIILAKLINHAVEETIDERAINYNAPNAAGVAKPLSIFQKMENLQIVVNSAKAIGCSIINVGASDIREKNIHIILGLVWQIIRIDLLSSINLKCYPELIKVFDQDGDDLKAFWTWSSFTFGEAKAFSV